MVAASVDNPALTAATRLATRWRPPAFVSREGVGSGRASVPSTSRATERLNALSNAVPPSLLPMASATWLRSQSAHKDAPPSCA